MEWWQRPLQSATEDIKSCHPETLPVVILNLFQDLLEGREKEQKSFGENPNIGSDGETRPTITGRHFKDFHSPRPLMGKVFVALSPPIKK